MAEGEIQRHMMASTSMPSKTKSVAKGRSSVGMSMLDESNDNASAATVRWRASDWFLGTSEGQWTALLLIASLQILLGSAAWSFTGGNADAGSDFKQSLWISWGLFFDPGTQTGLAATEEHRFKIVAVVFSLAGFLFNLTVLGLVVDLIRAKLDRWQQLYSRVVANDHVLVIGWGDKTLFLLCELLVSHEKDLGTTRSCCGSCCGCRRRRRPIVLLAEKPELEMQQEVHAHLRSVQKNFPDFKLDSGGIFFRNGDPTDRNELMKVSAPSACDILLVGKQSVGADSDQEVIQTLLALAALPAPLSGDVFTEMRTKEGVETVRNLLPEAEGIVARHAVNRILVLRALEPNVGYCYMDLLSFTHAGGQDLHLRPVPADLVEKSFFEVLLLYPDAVVVGLRSEDSSALIPEWGRLLKHGDQLVVLAKSKINADRWGYNDEIQSIIKARVSSPWAIADIADSSDTGSKPLSATDVVELGPSCSSPRVVLVIGCPYDIPDSLHIMDDYLPSGSVVHVLSQVPVVERVRLLRRYTPDGGKLEDDYHFRHIKVVHHVGSTTCKRKLMELAMLQAESALVLSESQESLPLAADSNNLTTVINLREVLESASARGGGMSSMTSMKSEGTALKKRCKVVTELLDPKSEQVVQDNNNVRKLGSYFYSNALETGVFAIAAYEKAIYNIIMRLLLPRNNAGDIAAVPVGEIIKGSEELSFVDLHCLIMQARGEILFGWRRFGLDAHGGTVHYPELNPVDKLDKLLWREDADDQFLVIRPQSSLGSLRAAASSKARVTSPSIASVSSPLRPPI